MADTRSKSLFAKAMVRKVDETFGSGIDKLKETIANQNEKIDTRITALLLLLRSRSTEEENPQVDALPASPHLPDSPDFNRQDPKPSYVINVTPEIPKASSSSTRRYKLHRRISLEDINERRLKGLCVFCEQPETPDHHIKHKNTGILMIDGDEDQPPIGESIEHCTVSLLSTAQEEKPNLENHENLVYETILEGESLPQFQVPISDSESLRNIELRKENSKLETLEYVVMNENENLEQEWVQKNVNKSFEVEGDVERSQNLISNTKICSAHQLFDKMSHYKERLGIKKKRKGFKSWMFKYKSGFRKLHALTFSKSMRMIETFSDLLLLNGKDSPARTAMEFKLEAGEIASSNQERLELCTESNDYLESSNLELVLIKEEPEFVKVNGVTLWTQSCNLKSDLIHAKMIVKKMNSLCNDESVYALEDFSSAVLEETQSQIYCGIDCDAFHSGSVFRFWKFTCSDMIPLGETVLTTGRKKTFYKSRRFKFKHRVAPRDFKSGFEVRGKQTAMWQRKANKEYLCLFWTNNVAACDHILLVGMEKQQQELNCDRDFVVERDQWCRAPYANLEITLLNQDRHELCSENKGCLDCFQAFVLNSITDSSSSVEEWMKAKPYSVKVNEMEMEVQIVDKEVSPSITVLEIGMEEMIGSHAKRAFVFKQTAISYSQCIDHKVLFASGDLVLCLG
ncbi:unnamed protein product [Arabidopsis lyrata]|nr:unnamed protein product [Arabidopsis lyrata]